MLLFELYKEIRRQEASLASLKRKILVHIIQEMDGPYAQQSKRVQRRRHRPSPTWTLTGMVEKGAKADVPGQLKSGPDPAVSQDAP